MQPAAARMHALSLAAVGSVFRPVLLTCASASTNSTNTAQALAVALAIKTKESLRQGSYILTDSQIACRYFTSGRVPACVAHLLIATLDQEHSIRRITTDRTLQLELLHTEQLFFVQAPVCNPTLPGISYNTSVENDGAIQHHTLG
ncbi:hypothetical protein HPB50_023498 [Hyalomma asiaticum]|uniref:Uncharacterized protein n=1 Tax=Hyalomma asiaticum TaxID=266040 RepID=A0ACB7SF04_HYAAI|nr:hypothetical protein HPB50_023498 [Hyalomma asiaticum]